MRNQNAKIFEHQVQNVSENIDRRRATLPGRLAFIFGLALIIFGVPAAASAGTVQGALFVDVNVDGVKQAVDTGAGGLPVRLMTAGANGIVGDGDDVTVASDTTDGSGNYSFTSVAAGAYYVNFDVTPFASAFLFSPKDQGGNDALDSDVDPTTGNTDTFSLGASATVTRDVGLVPVRVRSISGSNDAAIQATVDSFRVDLGTLNANAPGSANGGRREINWDGVPGQFSAPNNIPADFFNVNSPRGVVYSTPGSGFQVSGATFDSGAGQPAAARFGNIQATYTANFSTFSAQRLFTPLGSNITDVNFFVPGSTTPGFTMGFGAVFTDVEQTGATTIELFNQNGASLGRRPVPTSANGGFSFLGISFAGINARVVTRVRITTGAAALGAAEGANDLVVMDDFIYGEPVPNANLVLTETDSPDPVAAGANVTYTLTLTNNGTADTQNLQLTDATPTNTTFVSMNQTSGASFTLSTPAVGGTGTATASGASLAAGATATFTFVVRVNSNVASSSNIVNSPRVTSNPLDTLSLDNAPNETTNIITQADLSLTKIGPATASAGGNVSYTLTVANNGPSDASTVDLSDAIPANTTSVSMTQTSGPIFLLTVPPLGATGTAHATRGTMLPGTSATFTLVVKVNPATAIGTTINNTASVSTTTTDPAAINNSSSSSLTIVPPTLSIDDVTVIEGNSGSTNATFTVTLSSASGNTVSVDFFTSNGTAAQPSDFTAINGTLSFAPGQLTRAITVPVNGDSSSEPSETFFVNLANPTNADVADGQGVGTINDDDATGVFQFSAASTSISESAGAAVVNVTRTGDTSGVASVRFETSDGTAGQKADYTFESGVVQFGPGETTKAVNIPLVNDALIESGETFQVTLSDASGNFVIGNPGSILVTITDDDIAGAANPIDTTSFFVRQQYLDFLGREPDAPGLAFWTNNIASCGADANCTAAKRIETSAAFFLSIEFQESGGFALRMQRTAFGRQSNDPFTRYPYLEFMRDTRTIGQGVIVGQPGFDTKLDHNKQAYATQIALTSDFAIRFPLAPGPAYVDALFASAGVTPTAAERTAAINAFGAGGTSGRVAALRSVADSASVRSADLNPSFVLAEFYGYLRRNPTDAPDFDDVGYQFWLSKLTQFNGNFVAAEMVKAFITSNECRLRFGTP